MILQLDQLINNLQLNQHQKKQLITLKQHTMIKLYKKKIQVE